MASTFGPTDRNPDYARGEHNWCYIEGAESDLVLSRGNGRVHSVIVGEAGTSLVLKDGSKTIATIDTSTPSVTPLVLDVAVDGQLTATTVGAGTKLTIVYDGRPSPQGIVRRVR